MSVVYVLDFFLTVSNTYDEYFIKCLSLTYTN